MGRRNRQRDRVKAPTTAYDGAGRRGAGAARGDDRRDPPRVRSGPARHVAHHRRLLAARGGVPVRAPRGPLDHQRGPDRGPARAARRATASRRRTSAASSATRCAPTWPSTSRTSRPREPTRPEPLLLGAGPSPVPESVRARLCEPPPGPMDPAFTAVMDETQVLLREAFFTHGRATLPLTGLQRRRHGDGDRRTSSTPATASSAACAGMLGERLAGALARAGADVVRVEGEFGPRAGARAARRGRWTSGCARSFVVHGETLDRGGAAARRARRRLPRARRAAADRLRDVAGRPGAARSTRRGVDVAFAVTPRRASARRPVSRRSRPATARCASSSGASARPLVVLRPRRRCSRSGPTAGGGARTTTTAPIEPRPRAARGAARSSARSGCRRAGSATAARTTRCATRSPSRARAPRARRRGAAPALAVRVPEGVDEPPVRGRLRSVHGIEISRGAGALAGRVWRIGVMGDDRRAASRRSASSRRSRPSSAATRPTRWAALAEGWASVTHRPDPARVRRPARRLLPRRRRAAAGPRPLDDARRAAAARAAARDAARAARGRCCASSCPRRGARLLPPRRRTSTTTSSRRSSFEEAKKVDATLSHPGAARTRAR